MTADVLTLADLERAIASPPPRPPLRPIHLGHPADVAHLREHDGGRADCGECWSAWSRMQLVRVTL